MSNDVAIIGVGLHPFGRFPDMTAIDMGAVAIRRALTDVYNGCATAASALSLAAQTIRLGEHGLGIAVGMDKHLPGAFTADPRLYASRAAYEIAGIGPEDVDVIQLQDTDAGAKIIHLAENGFCADGEPIGASGLRQIHEIVLQLRGRAGDRQVPGNPQVGYTQLYGAPGTAGVSILST